MRKAGVQPAALRQRLARFAEAVSDHGRIHVEQPWALALGPLLLLLALVAPYRWLFYLGYVLLLLVVAGYAWVRVLGPRLSLRRQRHGDWAQVGDTLSEDWELANAAPIPLIWLEIDDQSTLPGYSARRITFAPPNERTTWRTSARCERRGAFTLGPLNAWFHDPFGMFRYEWRDDAARQVVVYPPLVRLPPLPLPRGQRGGLARADLLQQFVTPSVGGLREYVPGDQPSRIHWPTVARRGELMVKEFDQERAGALWIVLDLAASAYASQEHRQAVESRHVASESAIYAPEASVNKSSVLSSPAGFSQNDTPLELAVVLACSLAAQALSEGRAVGLLADDGHPRLLTPARGPRQLWRILSELVDVAATGELALADLLRQRGGAPGEQGGAALAVITPDLGGAWLPALASRQHGSGALALLVAEEAERASALASRLAQGGFVASTFQVGVPLPLLNPSREGPTERVSPLGRVVQG